MDQQSRLIADRYLLQERLGRGQMSSVYRALDHRQAHRVVAIKLLDSQHPDPIRREFFRRETVSLERLDHPHIVRILDSGWSEEQQCFFIVLEHLGRSLLDELHAHRTRDASWCWPIIHKVADALVYAHSEGVIHRDIKPANILFDVAGEPKITDFGISRLKHELATGMTVGTFWSPGYAAPEQRQGDAGDERSDVYSLGAVLFHLLSGTAPPADEPLAPLVSTLPVQSRMQQTLISMLAVRPGERIADMAQVRRAFESVDQATARVPQVLLIVTDQVRRDLFSLGLIPDPTFDHAGQALLDELGGADLQPVHCNLRHEGREVSILGRQIRISGVRHHSGRALVVTAAKIPYAADLEIQRASAALVRMDWVPTVEAELTRLPAADRATFERNLESLLEQLTTHERQARVGAVRRDERRSFLDVWDRIIRFQEQRAIERSVSLHYRAVIDDGDVLIFELGGPAPDDLPWEEGAALAVKVDDRRHGTLPVGSFVQVQGSKIWVDAHDRRRPSSQQPRRELPKSGTLFVFQPEEQALLRRQRDALAALRSGTALNPRLVDILVDVARAEVEAGNGELRFHQAGLDVDKRIAVAQALKAKDLFLLHGPPGTGKTTAITELILQILADDPEVRILVTSQSNVAVDHVLDRLAQLVPVDGAELLRVGRAEKLGAAARAVGMEQRLLAWRAEVLERCRLVLDELSAEADRASAVMVNEPVLEGLTDLKQWIEEAASWRDSLREKEEWEAAITDPQSTVAIKLGPETRELLAEIAADRAKITQHLAIVRSLLPAVAMGAIERDVDREIDRLRGVVVALLEDVQANNPLSHTRALVREWCEVVGLTPDFESLMLDRANVLGATCAYAGARQLRDSKFDWVIIDEAGRATAPEAAIPLVRGRRAVLVGDERQLPPMLDEEISKEWLASEGIEFEELERSLFERLALRAREAKPEVLRMLSTQHRMHPVIGELISQVFYEGSLIHGTSDEGRDHGLGWLPYPVICLSTSVRLDRYERSRGHSYENRAEAELVRELLARIERSYREAGVTREVGVLSGYSAQIEELRASLQPDERSRWQALEIEVATVDAFQGRDRDIVIYSATRSNREGNIGFMRDRRRLNVALSRARELLVIVGDHEMLARARGRDAANPFQQVIQHIQSHPRDCVIMDAAAVIGAGGG